MFARAFRGPIVGGIGFMNIMSRQRTERTREMGRAKGLSARDRSNILAHSLIEAVTLSAIGAHRRFSSGPASPASCATY